MRTMNCRNIRREIEEAGPGEALSSQVNHHLANCSVCATLAREQASLQRIVSSLGMVEAPGDFDFRLRARLAADKRRPQPFALAGFSFGLRSAVAMILIVAGAAIVFVAVRTRPDNSPGAPVAGAVQHQNLPKPADDTVRVSNPPADAIPLKTVASDSREIDRTPVQLPVKRHRQVQNTFAAYRDKRSQSRDESSKGATVLTEDQLAGAGPAFPIDASYQSLKVSIDDGRGSSRTISLPTVSFGSQRALSQGTSPLMASARGAW